MSHDRILILDFGSQVTQLIARRVREAHVYCEVHPNDVSADFIREFAPKGIILSGSHMSAYEESNDQASQAVFEAGVPVLGICYGMQTMAQQLGGKVESGTKREFGYAEVRARNHSKLLEGIEDFQTEAGEGMLKVWMSHGDKVSELPPGFKVMASTPSCPIAGMFDEARGFYAVQFHPEVTHTVKGREILQRFVLDICKCKPDWIMGDYAKEAVEKIRAEVGDEEVILGLSGGVDSSVTAALIHRAIGQRLTCVFVDNGLLRKNEREQVRETFEKNMGLKLIVVDAIDRFMNALAGVSDPEQKRKIIGREFVNVFQEEAAKIKNAKWLAQGTIYPDVIESAGAKTKKAKVIKSHHNVGGLPDFVDFKEIVEPLRDLFKDEVRQSGRELGLPEYLVTRQPFPGPGLAIRIIGEVTAEKVAIVQDADYIYREEVDKLPLAERPSQYFAALTNMRSVGVMGDERTYDYAIALRAVTTTDFMTAEVTMLPPATITTAANRIVNEVKHINRVLFDYTTKPPATIEFE